MNYFDLIFLLSREIILVLGLFILTILVHELGHYYILKKYTELNFIQFLDIRFNPLNFRISLGSPVFYKDLENSQLININAFGIASGWFIVCLIGILFPIHVFIIISVLYFLGTLNDWNRILRYIKNDN